MQEHLIAALFYAFALIALAGVFFRYPVGRINTWGAAIGNGFAHLRGGAALCLRYSWIALVPAISAAAGRGVWLSYRHGRLQLPFAPPPPRTLAEEILGGQHFLTGGYRSLLTEGAFIVLPLSLLFFLAAIGFIRRAIDRLDEAGEHEPQTIHSMRRMVRFLIGFHIVALFAYGFFAVFLTTTPQRFETLLAPALLAAKLAYYPISVLFFAATIAVLERDESPAGATEYVVSQSLRRWPALLLCFVLIDLALATPGLIAQVLDSLVPAVRLPGPWRWFALYGMAAVRLAGLAVALVLPFHVFQATPGNGFVASWRGSMDVLAHRRRRHLGFLTAAVALAGLLFLLRVELLALTLRSPIVDVALTFVNTVAHAVIMVGAFRHLRAVRLAS